MRYARLITVFFLLLTKQLFKKNVNHHGGPAMIKMFYGNFEPYITLKNVLKSPNLTKNNIFTL